ncbi:MAG: hypothetical protein KIS96_14580 [Bauldia sp.]|nr:hypothetical protein [Bauldia sp.]
MSIAAPSLLEDMDALADALTSKDAGARIMGRAVASGWPERLQAWVESEMRAPRADRAEVLLALARLNVQIFASIAAACSVEQADRQLVELYIGAVSAEMPDHLRLCRKALERRAGR